MDFVFGGESETRRRTLGIRERQILWLKSGKTCQSCGKTVDFHEMQIGHKTAYARGGATTLRNSVVLCYGCNKLQGTESWSTFRKKMGASSASSAVRDDLSGLSVGQLKALAKKHGVQVKGKVEETFFGTETTPPSKGDYVRALSRRLAGRDVAKEVAELRKPKAKRSRAKRDDFGWPF